MIAIDLLWYKEEEEEKKQMYRTCLKFRATDQFQLNFIRFYIPNVGFHLFYIGHEFESNRILKNSSWFRGCEFEFNSVCACVRVMFRHHKSTNASNMNVIANAMYPVHAVKCLNIHKLNFAFVAFTVRRSFN